MNLANLPLPDLIGLLLGLFFTLSVLSYVFGDNGLFRVAIHIFIGVASGYAAVVAFYNIFWPQVLVPIFSGARIIEPALLLLVSGLLLSKVSPRLSGWGSPVVAYLVGVAAATAIGGAVMGTLFPQIFASINQFDAQALNRPGTSWSVQVVYAGLALVATLTTLIYFQFGVSGRKDAQHPRRGAVVEGLAWIGQIFIAITFGTLFAGVLAASLAALVSRFQFLTTFVKSLLPF